MNNLKILPAGEDRLGQVLPRRKFGRHDEYVTQLAVGGYHIGMSEGEAEAEKAIEAAIAEGIRFFDTAPSYQDGRGEHRYGKFLCPKYRDDIFLLTKTKARTAAEAMAEIESSLVRMRTDRLDAVLMHAVSNIEDVEFRLGGGVYEAFEKAKEQGKVRYAGFSGHLQTDTNLKMLSELGKAVDVTLMPINAIDPSDDDSFILNVLPRLQELGVATLAMKTSAFGHFFTQPVQVEGMDKEDTIVPEYLKMKEVFEYALSQSITSWVCVMETVELIGNSAAIARNFQALDSKTQESIVARARAFKNNKTIEKYRSWG